MYLTALDLLCNEANQLNWHASIHTSGDHRWLWASEVHESETQLAEHVILTGTPQALTIHRPGEGTISLYRCPLPNVATAKQLIALAFGEEETPCKS